MSRSILNITEQVNNLRDLMNRSLARAAAFALLADQFARLPQDVELPEPTAVIRYGYSQEIVQQVRRDFSPHAYRFAVISMITACEMYLRRLLLIKRLTEASGSKGKVSGAEANQIQAKTGGEARSRPKNLLKKIVHRPSSDLQTAANWLDGIYRIRVCLAHRSGIVDGEDAEADGVMRALWRRPIFKVVKGGEEEEIVELPVEVKGPAKIAVTFVDDERTYNAGDEIQITAADCQHMALSLGLFGSHVAKELHQELTRLIDPKKERS